MHNSWGRYEVVLVTSKTKAYYFGRFTNDRQTRGCISSLKAELPTLETANNLITGIADIIDKHHQSIREAEIALRAREDEKRNAIANYIAMENVKCSPS